jgi:NAD dependent epimerase/dehydratase family enzyme
MFGEMAETLLLSGQRVAPRNLEKGGYQFSFSELSKALDDLLG